MTSINPTTIAEQLATAYIQPTQSLLAAKNKSLQSLSSALSKLQSALQAFGSALDGLSGKKSMMSYSATFSTTGIGSATASAGAQPGTYSLFVEQLASAHQMAYSNLPSASMAEAGTFVVNQADGASFTVDLTAADYDGDGTLSQEETARAINQAPNNQGKVSAMLVTTNGQTQMILSAASTGAGSQITLDTTGLPASALKDALNGGSELAAARDAVVWLGPQGTGVKMQQASNTYTTIPGVSMTFTRAMQAGESLTLTVAQDEAGTANNVRSFVDAYNELNKVLDSLTVGEGGEKGRPVFGSDAGIRALRGRLNAILREPVGDLRLMDFGVSADKRGVLSLDAAKLQTALAAHPGGLDKVFGSTSITDSSGLLGALDKLGDSWAGGVNGQIKQRRDSLQTLQRDIEVRQTRLDKQYSSAYERYVRQFSRLQILQSQMQETSGLFAQVKT